MLNLRSFGTIAASLALLGTGCGREEATQQQDDLHVANLKFTNITDAMAHVSCTVEPPGAADPSVTYRFGVADANGVATGEIKEFTSVGGFADLTDLKPDTTYAVTFIGHRGNQTAKVTPTLTFHTMKAVSADESFVLKTVPGQYLNGENRVWISYVQVGTDKCASGIAVTGLPDQHEQMNVACMDFSTMTAQRADGVGSVWSFGYCDCNALVADFDESVRQQCEARVGSTPACGAENASAGKFGTSLSGTLQVDGHAQAVTYLKELRFR